ncbi:MAG: hypothetical protein VXW36_04010 [Candidatus Thermoplasmatota archaeon]|nr:hypothetical protein [Candidatus Thermoplasmatota archaeon]
MNTPMGLLDRASDIQPQKSQVVTCRECSKRCEIPDDVELYLCPKCDSPLAEYPNIMADEGLFSFNNGINKWKGTAGPHAGIDSNMHSVAEKAAIGIITGRINPTFTFDIGRKFVKVEKTLDRSEHMTELRTFWWIVFFISIPIVIFAPPFFCCSLLSILLAIESGTQKKMSDVVLIAASKHPHLLAEEGSCYCYLEDEKLILAFVWKGHLIDINTAVQHWSGAYLKINWTGNMYGSHDDGYSVPAIEAVLRYPGRQRKIVMVNHEYTSKESAESELKSMVEAEEWYSVLGAKFRE